MAAKHDALKARFVSHLATNVVIAAGLLTLSLAFGMIGYRYLGEMPWLDSFLNASMILSGMGPVVDLKTASEPLKLFAGVYAIYCGVVLIATTGLVLAPVGSHLLRRFHLDRD